MPSELRTILIYTHVPTWGVKYISPNPKEQAPLALMVLVLEILGTPLLPLKLPQVTNQDETDLLI